MFCMALGFPGLQAKKRNQIVAIDLGSRVTKAVVVQRSGNGYELAAYSLLDPPVVEKGPQGAVLGEHLKKVYQEVGSRSKQAVVAIGVSDSVLRQAELPMMPVGEMRHMLTFSSKNYLGQDLPDHVFDCSIVPSRGPAGAELPKAGQKCRVLIGAGKQQLINDLHAAAKIAGFGLEMVVPSLVGPANAFELTQPEVFAREVIALVDIGFRNTTISVLLNGELTLTRVVGLGAEKLTSGLAESLGITYAEAEGMKLAMTEEVQMVLMPLLVPLGRELRASIDFFEHQQDRPVNQVFLSGGTARSEFIVKTLKEELMLETKAWNPAGAMKVALPPQKMVEIEQVAPQLAVAVGAALAAL
jgi:type IV pilus assembly protein PilM